MTRILATEDPEVDHAIDTADLVVVFSSIWDPVLESIRKKCASKGVRMLYDIDDLIFLPEVIHPADIHRNRPYSWQYDSMKYQLFVKLPAISSSYSWQYDSMKYQQALRESDAAILTTETLEAYTSPFGIETQVLPNTIGAALAKHAIAARALPRPSDKDGIIRIGFMSGTPTHDRNFAVIVPILVQILDERPKTMLVLTGYLNMTLHEQLIPYTNRIEIRPRVPLQDLFDEMSRLDIHVSPLEMDYPLCSCKSAIRVNFAGVVGVPSVASDTIPHRRAILDGITGFLASNSDQWSAALNHLLDNTNHRLKMGRASSIHSHAQYGPEWGDLITKAVYEGLIDRLGIHN